MKEHLPNDGFEDFIKKRLEAFDEEPTMDMWSRIKPVIPPKPLPFWKAIWVKHWGIISSVVALVGVSILLFLMYQQQSTSADLKEALKETNNQIEVLNEKVEQLNGNERDHQVNQGNSSAVLKNTSSIIGEMKNGGSEAKIKDEIRGESREKKQLKTTKKTYSTTTRLEGTKNQETKGKKRTNNTSFNTSLFAPPLNDNTTTLEKETESEMPMAHSRLREKAQREKRKENKEVIALLETLTADFLETTLPLDSLKTEAIDPIKLPKDKAIYVFAFGQTQWGNTRMRRLPTNGSAGGGPNPPKFTEQSKAALGGGLQIGFKLNERLSFGLGVGYNQTTTTFEIKHKVPYNKGTEFPMGNEHFGNEIRPTFSTVLGDYTDNLQLTRASDAVVGNNQLIELRINGTHNLRTTNLLGFAQYELFSLLDDRLTINAKGGVMGDFFLSHDLKWGNFSTNVDGLKLQRPDDNRPLKPRENAALNGFISMPISYEVNDFVSLTIEPIRHRSVDTHRRKSLAFMKEGAVGLQFGATVAF